jgi:phage tail protein X
MQSRYKNSRFKKTIDGREVLQSKIYPNIAKTDDDIYVATETGDRFDTLAYQFYNDSTLWWIIACANNIHNANIGIKEGTILRIPQNYIDILRDFEQ